jgi:hypothetical protein
LGVAFADATRRGALAEPKQSFRKIPMASALSFAYGDVALNEMLYEEVDLPCRFDCHLERLPYCQMRRPEELKDLLKSFWKNSLKFLQQMKRVTLRFLALVFFGFVRADVT